jgi:hypothetical protein
MTAGPRKSPPDIGSLLKSLHGQKLDGLVALVTAMRDVGVESFQFEGLEVKLRAPLIGARFPVAVDPTADEAALARLELQNAMERFTQANEDEEIDKEWSV